MLNFTPYSEQILKPEYCYIAQKSVLLFMQHHDFEVGLLHSADFFAIIIKNNNFKERYYENT